jgi:mannose/fructose/N-acetylgalactosamine-specific phosphotransferase system component IID
MSIVNNPNKKFFSPIALMKKLFDPIFDLFIWSSGAEAKILDQVPTEKSKYYGIGGTIVFTALMASFAGGYAFNMAFKNPTMSVFFGLFWGALIFNLDRYIVSTFGVGDGKKTISKQELIEAAPRLAMAIILGFVIATPLELKLFEKEINAEISNQISITTNQIIQSGENDPILIRLNSEKAAINANIDNRTKIIEEKRLTWSQANKDKNDEWNLGKFSGKRGKGGYYEDLKKKADDAEADYNKVKKEYSALNSTDYIKIDEIDTKIEQRRQYTNEETQKQKTVQDQNDGLMAHLKALDALTSENSSLAAAKWLITILFIFIEIAPILFKMMTERGPYDDILDRIKHETKVKQMLIQSNLNEEINTQIKINSDRNEQKIRAEMEANNDLMQQILKAQTEVAEVAIQNWKKEQIKLVKLNPGLIIQSKKG